MLTSDLPAWFWRLFGTVFGLLWGSFLNVVIYRLPNEMSVVRPASHCPHCGVPVKAYDNIPVVSWLVLRGRARCCKAPIGVRYPLVETAAGLLAWALVETVILRLPPGTSLGRGVAIFAADLALILGLVAASFIDLEHMFIPDSISLGGTVLGLATASFRPPLSFFDAAIGAAAGFVMVWLPFDVLYRAVRKKTGMAMGDAKLVMLAGAWFGVRGALFALLAGAVQASLVVMAVLLLRGKIDEPEAVVRERERVLAELEKLSPEDRVEAEKELAADPIFQESEGTLGARLALGPFLALATLEYLFAGDTIFAFMLD